jgi:2',3'-cyclic-nucleotide 2'-phosphodiesterase/3'-nucleotidase/5'-nucleotidase
MRCILTSNEGDVRGYSGLNEETTVGAVTLDEKLLDLYPGIQDAANLGNLKISSSPPAGKVGPKGKEKYTSLFSFGGRSFSIWTAGCEQVFDSGDKFEQITATAFPKFFNSNNSKNNFDNRSDDKGPEPEGVTVAEVAGVTYAFIVLERIGGIMVYDISDPHSPAFVEYVNNRIFTADPTTGAGGDSGPEGVIFVPGVDSPTGEPLLVVSNEVSGTVTVYRINPPAPSLP